MTLLNALNPFIINPIISLKFNALARTHLLQVESENGAFPWWGALLILGLVILIVVLALAWNASKTTVPKSEHAIVETHEALMPPPAPAPAPAPAADDLIKIEGIGPKIASLLQENGITTFDQLASADLDQVRSILDQASLRFIDPGSWPEQAKLAASGDWAALQALQERLKGGRE